MAGNRKGGVDEPDYKVRSHFYTPPSEFDGCFTTFYHMTLQVEDGKTVQDYLQPEWSNIRFFSGDQPRAEIAGSRVTGACFNATGPSSLPCRFELGTSEMWGIGLLPLGWSRFIDADAHGLANTLWDGSQHSAFAKFDSLSKVLCDVEATPEEQVAHIVETMNQLMRHNRDEPKILRVHKALVDGAYLAVKDLADACGMSIRTLERVCRRYFGFTPKRLMRRQRFIRSLTTFMLHHGTRWTEAMDAEYHDQAQFTREFHEFMTMNPSEYAALDHPILSSFMEARARVWGSAAQALDVPTN
ncbi:helix-turn-helix domain-containing protein [Erythrobacter rubeus]|uniref:helix-turn-helix domain-containing protein n=1 Tax=Erythrobacter rubeus TaxID=2760803 RepID=UPI002E2AB4C2|nr:helix-turn-helix domain-containing protein [Erythrobacter rubeus]